MEVYIRFDPSSDLAEVEDEAGNDLAPVNVERDGTLWLIGPLTIGLSE